MTVEIDSFGSKSFVPNQRGVLARPLEPVSKAHLLKRAAKQKGPLVNRRGE